MNAIDPTGEDEEWKIPRELLRFDDSTRSRSGSEAKNWILK